MLTNMAKHISRQGIDILGIKWLWQMPRNVPLAETEGVEPQGESLQMLPWPGLTVP